MLLVPLSDGDTPAATDRPRRIESRGPSGLERRAKPPGCLARSRRSQTRRAGCNGSGLWWRRSSHQATTFHRARQRSSTPLIAAACSAGMLPGRKGTASTACTGVQRRAARQRLIDRAVQERCPAWDWRRLTILDTTRGSDLEPRLVWELLVWRARGTHVRLPDPSRERYRARARRRETNLLTVC